MYVGKKYTATHTKAFDLVFECPCGFSSDAQVVGVGQGAGNSPYFLDEGGARERAQSSAVAAAGKNAEETVRLAPCPRCHKRPGMARFVLELLAGTIGIVVGMGLLAALVSRGRFDGASQVIFGLTTVACLGAIGYMRWIQFSTAPMRVSFAGTNEDDEAVRAPRRRRKKTKKTDSAAD